ncbi:MAG: transporter [Gammaproteobacteria bacterium]|nr:transporter [Gammaproteobacteria bacterium]
MTIRLLTLSLLLLPALLLTQAEAATCSCAGAPLLSAIDSSSTEPGDFFFNYTTEFHEISDLVEGTQDIRDESGRERSSFSQVISSTYGLADRWSVSGLLSYVEHSRSVGTSFLGEQNTSGLGDAVVLLRYTPLYITPFSRHEVSLGVGIRLPIGKDDAGGLIVQSEDMQPSVGAQGEILWSSYSYAFNQAATLQLNFSTNYTFNNEENDRNYSSGDEFNFSVGISQSIGTRFGYSAGLRYRATDADERNGFEIPNSGGEWLDFVPAIQYGVTDDLTLSLSGRVPVARNLEGALQFTTSYSYALSMTYAL